MSTAENIRSEEHKEEEERYFDGETKRGVGIRAGWRKERLRERAREREKER